MNRSTEKHLRVQEQRAHPIENTVGAIQENRHRLQAVHVIGPRDRISLFCESVLGILFCSTC